MLPQEISVFKNFYAVSVEINERFLQSNGAILGFH